MLASAVAAPLHIAGDSYAVRRAAFLAGLATASPRIPTLPKEAMPFYAARLLTGGDPAAVWQALETMTDATLREQKPDPFNLHAILHGYLVCPEKYPPALVAKFRAYAAGWDYTKPIGVSLNYELMRDGAGWLAAQEWPDLRDKAGNDAKHIQTLCGARLIRLFADTCAHNASEYDAPIYYGTDFAPARMLAEFAHDEKLRSTAKMTLDFMLTQTAAHWLHGYHISTAGRAKYWGSQNLGPDSAAPTNADAYLLFGGARPANLESAPQAFWLAHPGHALPLDWLPAWQAALPDARTVLASELWPEHKIFVRKIAWFTPAYGLASQREDGTPADSYLFKECRRTMLKWLSEKPSSTFIVCQENRRRPQEKIANAFAYGENPYTEVMQHDGTLLGVSDVPADYGFWKSDAPFTTAGAIVKRIERGGWIVCHGGSMLFAFRFVQPAHWAKHDAREQLDLYESDAPRNGWVLETSPLAPFAGGGVDAELERFAAALAAKAKVAGDVTASPPRVIFTNLAGHTLDLAWHAPGEPYRGQCVVDGAPVDYSKYPLLGTPNISQPNGGAMVAQLPGLRTVTYDFKTWRVNGKSPAAALASP